MSTDDIRSHILQQEADWERALSMNDAARLDEVMADDWRLAYDFRRWTSYN
jgi:hypothetical protein